MQTGGKGIRVLQLNRRETTVPERSVLHFGQVIKVSLADLDACAESATRVNEKRATLAEEIDLAGLHELLADEIRMYSFDELAGFICEPGDPDRSAALLRRLHGEQWFFRQKKEGYFPVSREEAADLQRREELRLAEEQDKEALTAEIRRVIQQSVGVPPTKSPGVSPPLSGSGVAVLPALEVLFPPFLEILLHEEEAVVPKKVREIVDRAGLSNPRKLFAFLVAVGRLKPGENLALLKHKVPREFPEACRMAAREIAALPLPLADRRDLRDMRVWVLDNESTRDRDDGFSIRHDADGAFHLWIHIADAAEFVLPGSELDEEARRRGTTLYFPDGNIPMFPEELSEAFLSLNSGCERCVMTQHLRFAPDGGLLEQELFEAVIRITDVVGYQTGDSRIAAEPDLLAGIELARLLREVRRKNGGLIVPHRPEGKLVVESEEIRFELAVRDSACQDMVAEFMIWTNHLSGLWFRENGVPGVFRVQEAPPESIEFGDTFQPLVFYRMIRSLSRTQVVSTPGRHGCLGVEPYLQITSPIRRYVDLLLQRQVKRVLKKTAPLSVEELMQVYLQAESSAGLGDSLMMQRYRHFLIRYLKGKVAAGEERFAATVVDVGHSDCQVFIDDIGEMMHCRKPSLEVKPGLRVEIRFSQLDPFDNFWRCEIEKELT